MRIGQSPNSLTPIQRRAGNALRSSETKVSQGEKRCESFQGLHDVARLGAGSVEGEFAAVLGMALSGVKSDSLATRAANQALHMISGGMIGPLGASIVAFGRSLTQTEAAPGEYADQAQVSSTLLKQLEQTPSTRLATELLDS